MPQVDFYVLSDAGDREQVACRLIHKAYLHGHRVYIHTPSAATALVIDDLLWTFKAGSFVPHCVIDPAAAGREAPYTTPVLIGHADAPDTAVPREVLLNLSDTVPHFFESFERVLEIVAPNAEQRGPARVRFAHYRDRGFAPRSHRLGDTAP